MNALTNLREQVQQAHSLLQAVISDVTVEQMHWQPPGRANSIAATYVHCLAGEDATVQAILQGGTPLYAATWADKTGVNEIQPLSSPEWARGVRVELPALFDYAQAVHAATDVYLANADAIDLAQTVDLSNLGLGETPIGYILNRFLLGHIDNMCGEISCLKGLQGGKGYPV